MGDGPVTTQKMGEVLNQQYGDLSNSTTDIATSVATAENKNVTALPDKLKKALNRDYSELVKTFDKK